MQLVYFAVMTILAFAQVLKEHARLEHGVKARTVLRQVAGLVGNRHLQPVIVTVMSKVTLQRAFYRYELPEVADSRSTGV